MAKINMLEERLNDKKEQLLEKELILEEVSSLAGRLRQQARRTRRYPGAAKRSMTISQHPQDDSKDDGDRFELSMYQASS